MLRAVAFAGFVLAGCASAGASEPISLAIQPDGTMQIADREVSCAGLRDLPAGTTLRLEPNPNVTYAQFSEILTCAQSLKLPILLIGEDAEPT